AVPQLQPMNAGVWLHLENKCAAWADHFGAVFVICGPVVFGRKPTKFIGDEGEVEAVVPDACYKIVVREDADGVKVLAFVIPQEGVGKFSSPSKSNLVPYLTSVDIIEALTGMDFLVSLADDVEAKVEKTIAVELWPTE
ncbi:MAG: DNA/RNA non-specific endonuclease, partial [Planctomycetota bacterium]|nr:DNA/RNA non-specific endonuclease [Planctomycetota bacterium]